MQKHKIEFTLPADLMFSSLVRRISEEIFYHAGFPKEWTERLKLVVDELFMNANHYGSSKEGGRIYLTYQFDEDAVTVRMDDQGKGEKRTNAEEVKKRIVRNTDEMKDTRKTNGRGLALISSLWTDEMNVEDSPHGGIAVSFTKKIMNSAPPPKPPRIEVGSQDSTSVKAESPKEEMKVSGEIDAANTEEKILPISEKVADLSPNSTLVLDCSELKYINSTFIGHMAAWINELQAKNGSLILKNVSSQVREVLELVGLTKVIYMES